MRILISLLVLVSLYACTPVYAQESGVIVSGVSTSLRSNKGSVLSAVVTELQEKKILRLPKATATPKE